MLLQFELTLDAVDESLGTGACPFCSAGCNFLHDLMVSVLDFLLSALAHRPLEDGLDLLQENAVGPLDLGVVRFLDAVHFLT